MPIQSALARRTIAPAASKRRDSPRLQVAKTKSAQPIIAKVTPDRDSENSKLRAMTPTPSPKSTVRALASRALVLSRA